MSHVPLRVALVVPTGRWSTTATDCEKAYSNPRLRTVLKLRLISGFRWGVLAVTAAFITAQAAILAITLAGAILLVVPIGMLAANSLAHILAIMLVIVAILAISGALAVVGVWGGIRRVAPAHFAALAFECLWVAAAVAIDPPPAGTPGHPIFAVGVLGGLVGLVLIIVSGLLLEGQEP